MKQLLPKLAQELELLGWTDESHKYFFEFPIFGLKFEPRTSRTRNIY